MQRQNFIKIHPFVLKILRKNTFLHQSRAIPLLFINKFSLICNPKPLLPNINDLAKIEENRSKTTQVRVRKQSADGWTDRHSNGLEGIT